MDNLVFNACDTLTLRVSALPRHRRHVASPALTDDGTTTRADLVTYISNLAKDAVLREAVHIASAALSRALDDVESGRELSLKKLTSIAMSMTRYALRMEGRSTPFGLFAGVARSSLGPVADVTHGDPNKKSASLDGHWLHEAVSQWLNVETIRRRVNVVINNLHAVRDGRIYISWVVAGAERSPRSGTAQRETSIRCSGFIEWLLEAARGPIPYDHLIKSAGVAFPQYSESDIDRLLAQMISYGFLLTSISPNKIDQTYSEQLSNALIETAAGHGFRKVQSALTDYEESGSGAGRAAWDRALAAIRETSQGVEPAINAGMRSGVRVTLPHMVVQEVENYATTIWRIAPEAEPRAHLNDYLVKFRDKYGIHTAVALPELIDPHKGLGYPSGYRNPPAEGLLHEESRRETAATLERRRFLGEIVHDALLAGDRELALTDEILNHLSGGKPQVPLRSLELCLQVLARDPHDLDNGDFQLLTSPFAGSWVAGAATARFSHLLDSSRTTAQLMSSGGDEETIDAQVTFTPSSPRALNVIQVPTNLLPFEIPLGVFSDLRKPGVIDWRELLVSSNARGFEITWRRTGQRVTPVVPHMLDLESGAPNLARLLSDFSFSCAKPWYAWRWAGLEALPVLPRVTHGRTVLSPLRWKADRHMRDTSKSWRAWNRSLDEWRERYRVPDTVHIKRRDQAICIDLNDHWHRKMLRQELTRGEVSLLEDMTDGGRRLGWLNGHSNELIIPLKSRHRPPAPFTGQKITVVHEENKTVHPPGGKWLFAKFYAQSERQNFFITHQLPLLLEEVRPHVRRWFFMRYRDPQPHLRVRFHGDAEALRNHVLTALERHTRRLQMSGAISSMQLASYEPEEHRYGGRAAMSWAEEIFHQDSTSALIQLRGRAHSGINMADELWAALNYAALLDSLGSWDWASWVHHAFQKEAEHEYYKKHRAEAERLIVPGRAAERLAEIFSAPTLKTLWQPSEASQNYAVAIGIDKAHPANEGTITSLLHMQHNRLIGINPEKEKRSYAILRGAVSAYWHKRRRGLV